MAKIKLMIDDKEYDQMGKHLMFYFPNDDPSRQLNGCLTKNTLIKDNATKYIYLVQTSGKRFTKVEAFDQSDKLLDTGHYLTDAETKQSSININKLLENLIYESNRQT